MANSNWIDDVVSRSSVANYIAWSGSAEFLKASDDDSAGRTLKLRLIAEPGLAHPFSKFTRRRRSQAGTRFNMAFAQVSGSHEVLLEVALLNWASNPQGQNVTLQIHSDASVHPFMWCKRASKEAQGTRWMITAVEIDDSEQLIEQEKRERAERVARTGNRQTLSNVARLFTKNESFYRWLSEIDSPDVEWNVERADAWLKETLGIESKAELDSDGPEAVQKIVAFHRLRAKFVEWQESQGITE